MMLRHPRRALVAALVLAGVCAALASGLAPSASPSLLADPDHGAGHATPPQERAFGAEPIAIAVEGDVATHTLRPDNLLALLRLEGRAARLPGVRAVYGPGTFINQTVAQIERVVERELGPAAHRGELAARRARAHGASEAEAEAARLVALGPRRKELTELFTRYGYVGLPSLTNRNFVMALVFGAGTVPKERFRWLFPDAGHAVVIVRPRAGLSDGELRTLGARLRGLAAGTRLDGVRLQVGGAPLVVAGIADEFAGELLRLAPIVVLALLLCLLLGLHRGGGAARLLVLAGGAALATAAASRVLGLGLTPATVAALPVVLGLAVDYGVQLQVRYWAERRSGKAPRAAAGMAAARLGPTLLLAAGAMSAGFLALTLSPVPLIDRLGVSLAAGTFASVAVVLAFGPPLLAAWDRGVTPAGPVAWTGAGGLGRWGWCALGAAAVLAVAGLAVSGGTRVQSDVAQLAPRGLPELRAAERVQRELGVGGTLHLALTGDVASPHALAWQARLGRAVLGREPGLRAGPNLGELLTEDGTVPDAAAAGRLLGLVPGYFLDAVITPGRRRADLSFGVPMSDVHRQAEVLDRIRPLLRSAPPGVHAEPSGLVATAVASVRDLERARPALLLLAALIVAGALLAVRRRMDRALLPLVPALLAAGLTALVVRAAGLELSPLGAGLEPLVLAVGVEFGLLLEARYRESRTAGASPAAARTEAVERVGGAVAVSAASVGVAFATLAAARLELLGQFGLLAALEVCLCAVLAIWLVPALCAEADRWRLARSRARRTIRAVPEAAR